MLNRRETGLALYAVALAAIGLIAPKFPVYWDSWGYLRQAIEGDVGGLGVGRPVFVLASHALARAWMEFGGSVWTVETLLRVFWAVVSSASAPLAWRLTIACGLSARAALFAGLAVATSPAVAHAAGTILTDGPAAAALVAALLVALRARQAASIVHAGVAGALLGVAIGLREQSMLNGLAVALLLVPTPQPLRLLAVMLGAGAVVAVLPVGYVVMTQPGYVDTVGNWLAGMTRDRAYRTFGWRDLAIYVGWLLSLGPLVVIAACASLRHWRSPLWHWRSPLFALAAPAFLQVGIMSGFLGITYSPRFLIPGFVGGLAVAGAQALDRWIGPSRRRLVLCVIGIAAPIVLAAPFVRGGEQRRTAAVRTMLHELNAAPPRAVIVTGMTCPAIPVLKTMILRTEQWTRPPEWGTVCPGWSWPVNAAEHFDRLRQSGVPVVVDLREDHWVGAEQRTALDELRRYVRARMPITASSRLVVWGDIGSLETR